MIRALPRILPSIVILLALSCNQDQGNRTATNDRQIEIFGQRIHYVEAGSGPAVVLLHGLGGDATNWQSTIPALAAAFHVYALDQIGFGQSDKPLVNYRVQTLVDFLDAFFTKAGIEKASLVGNSLGGWAAAAFTVAHPDKVEKLVLVDAAGYSPKRFNSPKFTREGLLWLNPSTLDGMRRVLDTAFYDKKLVTDQLVQQLFAGKLNSGNGYAVNAFIESIARGEDYIDGIVKTIKVPTLVLWGREDQVTPLAEGEAFASDIPSSQQTIIDRCGHVPQIECPAATNDALTRFLAGTRPIP